MVKQNYNLISHRLIYAFIQSIQCDIGKRYKVSGNQTTILTSISKPPCYMYIATSTMFHTECSANTLLNTYLYALFTSQVLHIKPQKEQLEKLFMNQSFNSWRCDTIQQKYATVRLLSGMVQSNSEGLLPPSNWFLFSRLYFTCTIVTKSGIIYYLQLSILVQGKTHKRILLKTGNTSYIYIYIIHRYIKTNINTHRSITRTVV